MNRLLMTATLMLFFGTAFANVNVVPTYVLNTTTNTLVIHLVASNSMPINMIYSGTMLFQFYNLTIYNVTSINNNIVTGGLYSDGVISVTAPPSTLPLSHKTVNVINNGTILNVNNVTIQSPSSVTITKDFTANYIIQTGETNLIPGVTFAWTVEPIPKFANVINVSFSSPRTFKVYPYDSQRQYNVTINLPFFSNITILSPTNITQQRIFSSNMFSLTEIVNPLRHTNVTVVSQLTNDSSYSFASLNLTVLVKRVLIIPIDKTLKFGQTFTMPAYQLTVRAEPFDASTINTTVLRAYYNANVAKNCLQTVNITDENGSMYSYCNRINGTQTSVYSLCLGTLQDASIVQGFGQCILGIYQAANTSALYWHSRWLGQNHTLTNMSITLQSYETGNVNANQSVAWVGTIVQDVVYFAIACLLAYTWLRGQKNAPRQGTRTAHTTVSKTEYKI